MFGGLTPAPKTPGVPPLDLVILQKHFFIYQGLLKFIAEKKEPIFFTAPYLYFSVPLALKNTSKWISVKLACHAVALCVGGC